MIPAPTTIDPSPILQALLDQITASAAGVQSSYFYAQAAGSDGADGSVSGIHVRWSLMRNLGATHLPKGNLAAGLGAAYPAPYGFNKPDDFVTVLRVPYGRRYPCIVNFSTDKPVVVVETGLQRLWKFDTVVQNINPAHHCEVVIRFSDVVQYDSIRASIDPKNLPAAFVALYGGVVEAEVTGLPCFALTISVPSQTPIADSVLRVEAVSSMERDSGAALFVSCRKRFSPAALPPTATLGHRVCAENVKFFRFDYVKGVPAILILETYEKFIVGSIVNKAPWRVIGTDFAVTDQDADAYARLDNATTPIVHHRWPRYSGANQTSGLLTASVPNYKAKWDPTLPPSNDSDDANGLREGVKQYLTLSQNVANPTARAALPSTKPTHNKAAFPISYLKMLQFVSLDFHVARMLGLGCIDADPSLEPAVQFVYVTLYRTDAPLDPSSTPAIVLPAQLTLSPGQTSAFPVTLSTPAPPNGVFVTLTSSNAAVSANTSVVYIPSGHATATQPALLGASLGSATITATAVGYLPATTQVQVAFTPFILLSPNVTLHLGDSAPLSISLSAPAPSAPTGATGFSRTHVFMTLPTSRQDSRLPPAPVQEDPTFGLTFDNGTGTPIELTDKDGYSPVEESRTINLHLQPFDTVQPFGPFFIPPAEFCSCEVTKPVFYGCKYKLVTEAAYRAPELSNDGAFPDPSGVPEVVPLVQLRAKNTFDPQPPIYTHYEIENGQHEYAFYGINWFSRPSPLGNTKQVDTLFPSRHKLLPPANLAVQLIQPEDPMMLTTPLEQQQLAALTGDSTLIRCTFDWNQSHYIPQKFSPTNAYADTVQFFFRQDPPRAVQGRIKSVTTLTGGLLEVRTVSYTITSVSPPQVVTPAVVPGDEPRFKGSSFAANQTLYTVDSVTQSNISGEGAAFLIRPQAQTSLADLDNNNQFSATSQFVLPAPGDRFLAVENLNDPANWDSKQPLAKKVQLVNFLEGTLIHRETVTYDDSSQATFNIGGIYETAKIDELLDVDDHGNTISGSRTGIFTIDFDTYQLAPHPDPDVEWYKGTVRINEAADPKKIKTLDVWKIDFSAATLQLTVHDATYTNQSNQQPPYHPIATGAGIPVNFHPGYRVYLKAQSGVLDEATTLPAPKESSRQTILSARARKGVLPADSDLTTPVVLQARSIAPPVAPEEPSGPLYATRPDFYGKSTWTMDVKVTANSTREPYALVFYRANEQSILDTLYKPDTVKDIRAKMQGLSPADTATRWHDLVNGLHLEADGSFHKYSDGFQFPIPDNADYAIPETVVGQAPAIHPFDGIRKPGDGSVTFEVEGRTQTMTDVVKNAINGVFLPLTESPVIYRFLRTATQTSSRKPVIRNANGDLLPYTSPDFDPAPMAVTYQDSGDAFVRFTDYTLDGAARNIYFYYAIEMSDQMKLGARSAIAGPILLVNAYPAEAPVIRKVTSVIEDPILGIPTGVKLALNSYIASEGITKFNLYRATNAADAAATRSMKLVLTAAATPGAETVLTDNFTDLDYPPFGDPIFYRVAALREIINEYALPELIPSQPSALARASVIDVQNPIAPAIAYNSDPPTMSYPVKLPNVVLSWKRSAYNPTYRLYKQESSGNWVKIYQKRTNDKTISVPLASTDLASDTLLKQNPDGVAIYHRFKAEVENSSGSFSLNENVLTIPATCKEGYAVLNQVVSYADNFQTAAPIFDQVRNPSVSTFPGSMTFRDIIAQLPPAHVYDRTEITVIDSEGHSARQTITASGGSVTFKQGDGTGIVLDGSMANLTYAVRVRVFTDSCRDGLLLSYKLRFGPEIALLDITGLLSYADSQNIANPLPPSYQPTGVQFPTTMSFTDVSSLPTGHGFTKLDIHVQDDFGGSATQTISAAGASVTFHHGDGGLTLDASAPSRTYQVTARLFTSLSQNGVAFDYSIFYS